MKQTKEEKLQSKVNELKLNLEKAEQDHAKTLREFNRYKEGIYFVEDDFGIKKRRPIYNIEIKEHLGGTSWRPHGTIHIESHLVAVLVTKALKQFLPSFTISCTKVIDVNKNNDLNCYTNVSV